MSALAPEKALITWHPPAYIGPLGNIFSCRPPSACLELDNALLSLILGELSFYLAQNDENAAAPVVALRGCDEKAEHIAKQFAPLNLHLLPLIIRMLIHFFSGLHVDLLGIPYVWWSRFIRRELVSG